MTDLGLEVQREVTLNVVFRNRVVGTFRADTVVNSRIILEYKTSGRAIEVAEAQLMNYLRCTDKEVGLLLKFFEKPKFKRCFLTNDYKKVRGRPFIPWTPVSQAPVTPLHTEPAQDRRQ